MATHAQYLELAKQFEAAAESERDRRLRDQLQDLAETYLLLAGSTRSLEGSEEVLERLNTHRCKLAKLGSRTRKKCRTD